MPGKRKKKPPEKKTVFKNQPFRDSLKTLPVDIVDSPAVVTRPEESPEPELASDADLFIEAVRDTVPLKQEHELVVPLWNAPVDVRSLSDEELVMRRLDELVNGNIEFDLSDSDEYIEACISGFDRHTLKRLRAGEFSVQAHLDLHGFRVEEARLKVAAFIEKVTLASLRCVLIVHGRGLRSPDRIPVLKENLRLWLTRGVIGRHVLAYTSARPSDGGTGAVYVLLRQRKSDKFR